MREDLVQRLRHEIDLALIDCFEHQKAKGLLQERNGAAHHVLVRGGSFLEFIQTRPYVDWIGQYLGGKVIVNSFGANSNGPTTETYYKKTHRDVRFFVNGFPTMLTMIVSIDPFTSDNGGTWLLPSSHLYQEQPTDQYFQENAIQLVAPAGSITLFDSAVWHAAGVNRTNEERRALTLTFTRPFFKPQFDYSRAMGEQNAAELDDATRELIGFMSRVPQSLDEWYVPAPQRMYRADQV
jgi:ectoine hydroxylase-related dioxygenase (phytanoyl-CoA dioxygenase family)